MATTTTPLSEVTVGRESTLMRDLSEFLMNARMGDDEKLWAYMFHTSNASDLGRFSFPRPEKMMARLGWRSLDRVDAALALLLADGRLEKGEGPNPFKKGETVDGYYLHTGPPVQAPRTSTVLTDAPSQAEPRKVHPDVPEALDDPERRVRRVRSGSRNSRTDFQNARAKCRWKVLLRDYSLEFSGPVLASIKALIEGTATTEQADEARHEIDALWTEIVKPKGMVEQPGVSPPQDDAEPVEDVLLTDAEFQALDHGQQAAVLEYRQREQDEAHRAH